MRYTKRYKEYDDSLPVDPEMAERLWRLFVAVAASDLYALHVRLGEGQGSSVLDAFSSWLETTFTNNPMLPTSDQPEAWDDPDLWFACAEEVTNTIEGSYPGRKLASKLQREDSGMGFLPYSGVNFGIRLVYRQRWQFLGVQPGDIVKTIPLGPRQVEKVTFKRTANRKSAQSRDVTTSTESSTENTDTTKDVSELVEDASSKFGASVSTTASAGYGAFSGSVEASANYESGSSTKETTSSLNEAVAKAASKKRTETKIVVSTEVTASEEYTTSSEISNPNDDVAVTYVYSQMQRQYRIVTQLAELDSVVLVPEEVPAEFDAPWIQRFGWIIRKNLLDHSMADDLAIVMKGAPVVDEDTAEFFKAGATGASASLEKFSGLPGALPDVFRTPLEAYERELERKRVQTNLAREYAESLRRLSTHIRENSLHYLRGVWAEEDPERRMLRYSSITIPAEWTFVSEDPIEEATPTGNLRGEFIPDPNASKQLPLLDVVSPAGLLGWMGNYAVFALKEGSAPAQLNDALAFLRAPFVRYVVEVEPREAVRDASVEVPRYPTATYSLTPYLRDGGTLDWRATLESPRPPAAASDGRPQPYHPVVTMSGGTLRFDGVRLELEDSDGPLRRVGGVTPLLKDPLDSSGSIRVVVAATAELQDPEERSLRDRTPLPSHNLEPVIFTPELLRDMAGYLPSSLAVLVAAPDPTWSALDPNAKRTVRQNYFRYLLLRDATRDIVIDTCEVMLDLQVGGTPALEDYKRLHRAVDVLKAAEDYRTQALDNARREDLQKRGDLRDPDVDAMVLLRQDVDAANAPAAPAIQVPLPPRRGRRQNSTVERNGDPK